MGSGGSKPQVPPPLPEKIRPRRKFMGSGFSQNPQFEESETLSLGFMRQHGPNFYSCFSIHEIRVGEETGTVIVSNVVLNNNIEAACFASLRCDLFRDQLHILTKEEKLNKMRVLFYFYRVQELLSSRVEQSKNKFEQRMAGQNLDEESDSDWEEWDRVGPGAHQDRKTLRNLRNLEVEDTCICCRSTVVIVTDKRIIVAGPGQLVTAIASPSGLRTLSLPGPAKHSRSEDVEVLEFEGGLKQDEFLVQFLEPSHVTDAQSVSVSGTEDVAEMCKKLSAAGSSVKPVVFVAKKKEPVEACCSGSTVIS